MPRFIIIIKAFKKTKILEKIIKIERKKEKIFRLVNLFNEQDSSLFRCVVQPINLFFNLLSFLVFLSRLFLIGYLEERKRNITSERNKKKYI